MRIKEMINNWSSWWLLSKEVWDLGRSLCCLLSQNLSPPRSINLSPWIVREAWWNARRWSGNGQAFDPGANSNTPCCFVPRSWNKFQLGSPLGWSAAFSYLTYPFSFQNRKIRQMVQTGYFVKVKTWFQVKCGVNKHKQVFQGQQNCTNPQYSLESL